MLPLTGGLYSPLTFVRGGYYVGKTAVVTSNSAVRTHLIRVGVKI
jgi:hypothetical protein